ncbi:Ribosomal protein S16, mitochondrial [Bacidia gigantensis]|uniref:Ribosomal protein S16, mitochondrial n=1 Tax=Bacidia gigantensis TaxID=2732470 RepID=UPI001D05BB0A|nr:Ribosomal protein S16, mitochondrial [Bacidia gigantensis]KAG8525741.1 Ribosomal protein S16, mitochondrial [Bacidia gigantensis]
MVLKIRLARFGKAHKPFYNIVVAQARSARNSRPLEVLGTYDPIPKAPALGSPPDEKPVKDIKLDIVRAKYWLGVGAQPSEPAQRLLALIGLIEPKFHIQKMKALGEKVKQQAEEKEEGAVQTK